MVWSILFHDAFEPEFAELEQDAQDELLAKLELLASFGPTLGRPHVDTLAGSRHANMKELRFAAEGGVWRVAFAFDPLRQAVILVAGDKAGTSQARFYRGLIKKADGRFDKWLTTVASSKDEV